MKNVYLDSVATTPCHPDAAAAAMPYFTEIYGNPQSDHEVGWKSKMAIDEARHEVAALINATPEEIIYTSSGTEANNFGLKGVIHSYSGKGKHFIISAIEHRSILTASRFLEKNGHELTVLPVDRYGLVDPEDVRKAIRPDTVVVSVIHGNNEIGTVEPIAEIGRITREAGVLFLVDAGSSGGVVPVDVKEMNADLLTLSAHNFYGPKGVGALYVRKGVKITPLIHGGAQERGRRTGIENVPGIVGMGVAARLAKAEMPARIAHLTRLRDRLETGIVGAIPNSVINGHPEKRLPHMLNMSFEGVEGESMLLSLADEGVFASSASTCTMMSLETSYVLLAIGLSGYLANSTLMMSLGIWNTDEDVNRVIEVLPPIIERLRAMSAVPTAV
ncbi:MAG: aminotransferase class V-fold PLP-dependent enzyme [Nitrospirae bacterium]|nr:aminotransferase class V-fold PLP-dependent enzyme [Nitrospirota bacterium]